MKPTRKKAPTSRRRSRWAVAFVLLFGMWFLLSGKTAAFSLLAGAASVFYVIVMHSRLPDMERPGAGVVRVMRVIPYIGWLFVQMLIAAVQVAVVIIHPRKRLDPVIVEFQCAQPSMLQSVILANSITLTPGTITVDLEGDRFLVHALTRQNARDLLKSDMAARVARLSDGEATVIPLATYDASKHPPRLE